MNRSSRQRLALVGAAVLIVSAVTPTVAAQRPRGDAHTVDGKHAVGASASKKARAGKLVATNKKGFLPNNIIRKAPDAALLDGQDSSAFATTREPVGYAFDVMKSPARTATLGGAPTVVLDVPLQTADECGGGETVHRYLVEFTGWLIGGPDALMEASMAVDTTGHAFGEGTVVGSGYNAVASTRVLLLPPGAHTVNMVASKTGPNALTLADGFLGVTDLGYECGLVLREPAARSTGSGPGGT